ncbi:MAG: ATP-binding protein [Fibrobacterota bacterium]
MERGRKKEILADLEKKMVFIVGPRQVGKTWLAKDIAKQFRNPVYLNYDRFEDRKIIESARWLDTTDLLILDEIHKMPEWKNRLKGVFDTRPSGMRILVTSSARLDTFRQSGDSMAGRFFSHRLLPFSLSELPDASPGDMDRLITCSGFPEPYLAENGVDADRWRMQYVDGLIRNDILDFEKIHDFKAIQLVFELLRRRVGSPLSYTSIAEDVQISATTVKKYVEILESLFIVFRVTPYSKNIARSLVKEPKVYFYDNGLVVGDEGAKFENFVAISLQKHVFETMDYTGKAAFLQYIRTREGKEVDFCIAQEGAPLLMIEAKSSDPVLDKNLVYFNHKYNISACQIVRNLRQEWKEGGISVVRAESFLRNLR